MCCLNKKNKTSNAPPSDDSADSADMGEKIKILNFNTSWCSHSKKLEPIWKKLQQRMKKNPNIDIIDIKCDDDKNKNLCEKFGIKGYPTIIKISKDGMVVEYEGPRSFESLVEFCSV
jgi:thiol-disulfide isomerase/thioredoxin